MTKEELHEDLRKQIGELAMRFIDTLIDGEKQLQVDDDTDLEIENIVIGAVVSGEKRTLVRSLYYDNRLTRTLGTAELMYDEARTTLKAP